MCNRLPTHAPGNCPPLPDPDLRFVIDAHTAFQLEHVPPVDPRDAELAAIRSQLAAAMKVVEAAQEWHRADYGSATEFIADAGLNDAVIEYNAKHGAK